MVVVGSLVLCCLLAGFGLAVGSVHAIIAVVSDDPFDDLSFDRELWIAHARDDSRDNARGKMARDLRRLLMRDRPRRAEVLALLGDPDSPYEYSRERVGYALGSWHGFRIDDDTLDIVFDEEERVLDVQIVPH
ncbi:MAG: hypothetical protein ACT4PV_06345 [Planctomycetaceae bacterium]